MAFSESEDDSNTDGEIRVTLAENEPGIEPDFVQFICIGQQ